MKPYKYLTFQDRKLFEEQYKSGVRIAHIAKTFGIHITTAYSEIYRGRILDHNGDPVLDKNHRQAYSAEEAQRRMQEGLKRRGKRRSA